MNSGQLTTEGKVFAFKLWAAKRLVLLTGEYKTKKERKRVTEALAFWKTIRGLEKTGDKVWAVFKQYSLHENVLVRTAAKLEALPTRVFRRVLWFYNIDYQSLESCLRRLTPEQIASIDETYSDLFGVAGDPKVPRCFTEGLYNFVQQHNPWKRVAVEDLLNEEENDGSRYETKGAIAFNFFEWDMGFYKYPKEATDEMLADTVAETFLSLTNKISTEKVFTTNKGEGGTYRWLYKTCRSNYLWNRGKAVEFSKKTCPAFWYTMAVWAIFLFLSPVAFYISIFGTHGTHWHSYLRDALGLVTPGIFLAATVKYVVLKIGEVVGEGVEWLEQHIKAFHVDREYWENFGELVGTFAVCAIVALVTCAIWEALHMFFLGSIFSATLITTFLVFYVFHMVYYEKWMSPTSVPWVGKPIVLFVVLRAIHDYHEDILHFLIWVKQVFVDALTLVQENIPLILVAVSWLGFAAAWKFAFSGMNKLAEDGGYHKPETRVRMEKFYATTMCVTWVFTALCLGGSVYFLWLYWESLWQFGLPFLVFVLVFFAGFIALDFFLVNNSNPLVILNEKKLLGYENDHESYSSRRADFYKLMARNGWIRTLEDPLPVVEKLWKFADRFLRTDDYRELFLIDEDGFALLSAYSEGLSRYHGFNSWDVVPFMVQGKPFKEAIKILSEEQERKQNFRRKLVRIYDLTLGRIVGPIQKFLEWIRMMLYSAQKIWSELNEMCPLETQTKEIK